MTEQEILSAKLPFLRLRCLVLQAIRRFFLDERFLEVQTPLCTDAPAPEVHIDAVPVDKGRYLVTSPELYMKRLLAAGYDKIFQISPVFRQGEQGRFHHPEFTILEWYRPKADYKTLQKDCQRLIASVCKAADRSDGWHYQGHRLEANGNWKIYSVREAFALFAGWMPDALVNQDRFDVDLAEKVEPHLGFPRPCFLEDYPANQAALARLKPNDSTVAERFELYWGGLELANGFTELTDADEQRSRFSMVLDMRREAGRPIYTFPDAFLKSMRSLPPCAGIALGVDRLVMLLADADHIDRVVAFPPGIEASSGPS
jgi:lysyl-tRNA synthetase class 2